MTEYTEAAIFVAGASAIIYGTNPLTRVLARRATKHRPSLTRLADPTPLPGEQGLGPIFEEGYQRQAKRLGSELSDPAAVDAWLAGGER